MVRTKEKSRISGSLQTYVHLFRTSLLGLLLLAPTYLAFQDLQVRSEKHQNRVLFGLNRMEFDYLSFSRAINLLPLQAFLSHEAPGPADIRLARGWIAQGQATLLDMEHSRTLLTDFQRGQLSRLESLFGSLTVLLSPVLSPQTSTGKTGNAPFSPSFESLRTLEREMRMTLISLSFSVRSSLDEAQKSLYLLDKNWGWAYGGLIFAFLVGLILLEGREVRKAREDVSSREFELKALFDAMRDVVVFADARRKILFANPAIETVFGFAPEEVEGHTGAMLYARPEDFEEQGRIRYHPDAADSPETYEMRYRRKDGSEFTGEAHGAIVRDLLGGIRGFMLTVRDVTARKEMMDSLFLEKEKWFVTLGSIGDAVITTDMKARIEYMNAVAENLTGWTLSQAVGKPVGEVFDILNEITRSPADNPVEKSLRLGVIVGLANHTILRSRLGPEYAIEDSAAPIRSSSEEIIGCVIVFRDVTQKRDLLQQVTRQANFDALTDLPNRYLFQDRMGQMIAQAHRHRSLVALFYLDLDHFKKINDTLGHPFGDLVLKETARRLQSVIRESDTVARLGGDEFTVIAGDVTNREDAVLLAQKILEEIAVPYQLEHQEIHLTSSIGVALYPEDGESGTTLVRNADIAMYQAKDKGRNNIMFFSPDMNQILQERTSLENSLHHALDRGEFRLLYQPIIDLRSGKPVAMEALVRWHHPQRGIIPPSQFIPVAEENGIILPLGEWILETACRQAREWLDRGVPPLRMTINVSIRQLTQGDLPGLVERLLASTGIPAGTIELELTETMLMKDTDKITQVLGKLRRTGIRLSIDDFGTGYSSLGYLSHFSINTLKIDGSFTQGINIHPNDGAIIKTILALAHSMSLDVVAEGVETREQAQFLLEHDCPHLQGFLFSLPLPAEEIPALMNRTFRIPGP